MRIIYRTNEIMTTASMTAWYFGKRFVTSMTRKAKTAYEKRW